MKRPTLYGPESRSGVLTLVGGIAFAALGLLALRPLLPEVPGLHEDPHVVVAGYAAGLSIVYGALLAFTVVVVWEQMNRTHHLVEEEATRIEGLWRLLGRFDDEAGGPLRSKLREYATVTATRWARELDANAADEDPADAVLVDLWHGLIAAPARTAGERVVHAYALDQFEELHRVRARRRVADRERLHPVMWVLLLAGAAATTISMYFFELEPLALHGALSALVGGVLAFILFLIHDLDDPFDGVWRIDAVPLERAARVCTPNAPAAAG